MPLPANTVWEVRTTGSDTNGGGFVTGSSGTDFSQQDSAQYSLTNGVATTSSSTIGTVSAAAVMVGNIAYVAGGTGSITAGWYQIISVVVGTSITVDRSTGLVTGTGVTITIGGALASIGQCGALVVTSNTVWIKSGSYTITATTSVPGGCFNGAINLLSVEGYNSFRGDLGQAPVFTASGISSFTMFKQSSDCLFANLSINGNNLTSSQGFSLQRSTGYLLTAINLTNSAFLQTSSTFPPVFIRCKSSGCSSAAAFLNCACFLCEAFNNTAAGFSSNQIGGYFCNCLSYSNSGVTSDGFACSGSEFVFINCTSYGNGRHGFNLSSNAGCSAINCIAESNGGYGFVSNATYYINCATYNNSSGSIQFTFRLSVGLVTYGASAFVAAGSNFALNSNNPGGAQLRTAGIPGTFPDGLTTGYLDIGAAQHQDTPAIVIGKRAPEQFPEEPMQMLRRILLVSNPPHPVFFRKIVYEDSGSMASLPSINRVSVFTPATVTLPTPVINNIRNQFLFEEA